HPGYGFLSENAEFAQAVLDAGLTWIGPPPAAIAAMGSKVEAKKLMAGAAVPVLPELDPAAVTEADLPVLIKASAGGGGRGMRVVRTLADLPGEIATARAEAASAFGDPPVFCEPSVEAGRGGGGRARCSAGTRRWSRRRRPRWWTTTCAPNCPPRRWPRRRRSTTSAPGPSSSWPSPP